MTDILRLLMQQASGQGSRTTALNPLTWGLGISLTAFLVALEIPTVPSLALIVLGTIASVCFLGMMVAYFILLFIDRDALRSERFKLSKMALEKSAVGDSRKGFGSIDMGEPELISLSASGENRRELSE